MIIKPIIKEIKPAVGDRFRMAPAGRRVAEAIENDPFALEISKNVCQAELVEAQAAKLNLLIIST